ncbi:MAG: PAQR family membrane homeostasis protein TrhA [Candidatus Izemoplasmataceae bacterium]|uniref:PAQR family membrane homeostasis protein TrhA n=1 Tax=Liberiplasma polymorphum TaxID=3374570 RepID=UPI0037744872
MNKHPLGELIANAISHGIGVLLSVSALIVLIYNAHDTNTLVGTLIFSISLILLYLSSTLYHSFPPSMKRVIAVFQRLDHSAIYILIAGTYTPFVIILLPTRAGYTLLTVLWLIALIGITLKSIWVTKYHVLHLIMYLLMGWSIVAIWPNVYEVIPQSALYFLIIGGVSYTAGVVFYINRFKYAHFIWHLFVLSGSIFHFLAIYNLL